MKIIWYNHEKNGCDLMKKILSAAAALLILLSLCSCSAKKETALVISGTEISKEIFTYYFCRVVNRPEDFGIDSNAEKSVLKDRAILECKEYLAANTNFALRGLSLSAAEKVEISQQVNNLWLRFENYYKSIGVSKQTLTKIMTVQAYEDAIFTATYDKGSENTESESEIQNYFYSSYVSFKNVCAYFTKSDGTAMSQLERNKLAETFGAMESSAATTNEKFASDASAAGYSVSDSVLLKKGSTGYPDGFFEKVSAQSDGTVQIIIYDDCIFAVMKENLKDKGESVYANYRSSCISDLYFDEYQKTIDNYTAGLSVEEKSCVNKIVKQFG